MTPPVPQACGCGGLTTGVWHHQDRRRRGPHALTGIVDHSRGGSSHGPLELIWSQAGLAPCMRTGWPSVEKTSVQGCKSRRWIPFQGQQERHRLASSKTQPASSMPSTSSHSPVMLQVRCAAASSKTPWVTADAQVPPLPDPQSLARLTHRLTPHQKERLREAFVADEAYISVEVAYHCA